MNINNERGENIKINVKEFLILKKFSLNDK